LTCKSSPTTL